jgi:hypothetical protein
MPLNQQKNRRAGKAAREEQALPGPVGVNSN